MDYAQPFGAAANAPYVNGNPSTGQAGSIPPAAALEAPQREILAVIAAAGLTPSGSDLTQLLQAIRVIAGGIVRVTDTGSANALAGNGSPLISAYAGGQIFQVTKAASANTSTAPTLNVNGKGAKTIVRRDGSALAAGDLPASAAFLVLYDGTNMRLLGLASSEASSTATTIYQQMVAASGFPGLTVITASGVYTPSPGARRALVFATGGGGAGGQATNGTSVGQGGESGATAIKMMSLSGVSSVACSIGAGGAPSAAPAAIYTRGGSGGQTSFGSYAVAPGGMGGYNNGADGMPAGGTTGGAGDLVIPGNPGEGQAGDIRGAGSGRGGNGGASFWGGAGVGYDVNTNGVITQGAGGNATGYGSGGGGTDATSGQTNLGGSGRQGVIFILEF